MGSILGFNNLSSALCMTTAYDVEHVFKWKLNTSFQTASMTGAALAFFTVRRYALHGLCDHNSVRLSVCLSVCPSHS